MSDGLPCWADLTAGAGPEFYGAVLGWTFTDEGAAAHHEVVALDGGRRVAGLGGPEGGPPGWTLYVAVPDAAEVAEAVEEAGGQVLHGPDDDGADGGLVVVAIDAGGAPFGVWEADVHADPLPWVEAASAEPGQTKSFYRGVFGWTHGPTDEPGTTTLHHGGGAAFGAVTFAGDALPHWLVHFGVADVDAAAAAAEAAGGLVVGKEAERAVLEDPTGAWFAVVRR